MICQMSEAGQDVCILRTIGACARTAGAASIEPAAAAPPPTRPRRKNDRRLTAALVSVFIVNSSLTF